MGKTTHKEETYTEKEMMELYDKYSNMVELHEKNTIDNRYYNEKENRDSITPPIYCNTHRREKVLYNRHHRRKIESRPKQYPLYRVAIDGNGIEYITRYRKRTKEYGKYVRKQSAKVTRRHPVVSATQVGLYKKHYCKRK